MSTVSSSWPRARGHAPAGPISPLAVAVTVVVTLGLLGVGLVFGLTDLFLLIGACALAGGAYLLWQVDPVYPLSLGFLLSPFAGNWSYMHIPHGIDPDRVLFTFGILQVLMRAPAVRHRPRLRFNAAHKFMLLAVLYVIVSAHFAGTLTQKGPGFEIFDSFGILPFLAFLVAPVAFRTPRQRSILLLAMVLMGTYLGLTTVFETAHINALVYPKYILNPNIGIHYGRGRGPFLDAIANGFALAVCAVACGIAARTWSGTTRRVLATLIGLLCLAGAFMSLERSVWIGTGLGILIAMALTRELRRYILPTVLAGLVGVALALLLIPGLSTSVSSRAGQVATIYDRENLTTAAIHMIEARPLQGFGWEMFQNDSALYFTHNQNYPLTATSFVIHNFFLSYMVGLGLMGFTLWLLSVVFGFGSALLTRGPPEMRLWHTGLIAIVVLFLVVSNAVPPTLFPNFSVWLWAGVVFSGRYATRGAGEAPEPAPAPELAPQTAI